MSETLILTEKLGWKVSKVIWKFIAMGRTPRIWVKIYLKSEDLLGSNYAL